MAENLQQYILDNIKCTLTFKISDTQNLTNGNILELCAAIKQSPCTLQNVAALIQCDQSAFRRDLSSLSKFSTW